MYYEKAVDDRKRYLEELKAYLNSDLKGMISFSQKKGGRERGKEGVKVGAGRIEREVKRRRDGRREGGKEGGKWRGNVERMGRERERGRDK